MLFCYCDLDLDLITSIYKLDLDILNMILHTKNQPKSRLSEAKAMQTDRQTGRCDCRQYHATCLGHYGSFAVKFMDQL